MPEHFPLLFSPLKVGSIELPNRITITAHGTHFAENGLPTQRHVHYHAERARGGVGMIVFEAIRVHPTTWPNLDAVAGWKPEIVERLALVADAVRPHGTKFFGQIVHQGSQVGTQGMRPASPLWAPSPVACARYQEIPHAMTHGEIDEVIEAHVVSARHVKQAGCDGLEIHAAHGYLPQQFLSPYTNRRDDEYGGSLENRLRFLRRLIVAVRDELGSGYPLGLRISGDEFTEGGLDLPAMQEVASLIAADQKIDYLSVSHCNYQSGASYATMVPDMHFPPMPFVHIAEGIRQAVRGRLPVIAVGRITTPQQAEKILSEGKADLVAMTRAHIADPELPRKTREGRTDEIRYCLSCNQGCVGMAHAGKLLSCVVNPTVGLENVWGVMANKPATRVRRVIVVGGGPAGMEAARVAAERGHHVTLYEKSSALGGQINLAVKQVGRDELGRLVDYESRQLKRLGVTLRLGQAADVATITASHPDAVVIATGARQALPNLPGAAEKAPNVVSVEDIFSGAHMPSRTAVVWDHDGHYKAASTSEHLATQGVRVFHVTPRSMLAPEVPAISVIGVNQRLRRNKVVVMISTGVRRLVPDGVVVYDVFSGQEETIAGVDTLVVSGLDVPENSLFSALQGKVEQLYVIGDAAAPRRAFEAVSEGHRIGRGI